MRGPPLASCECTTLRDETGWSGQLEMAKLNKAAFLKNLIPFLFYSKSLRLMFPDVCAGLFPLDISDTISVLSLEK